MGFFFAAQYTDSLRSKKSTSHDALRIVLVDFFCKDIKIDIQIGRVKIFSHFSLQALA